MIIRRWLPADQSQADLLLADVMRPAISDLGLFDVHGSTQSPPGPVRCTVVASDAKSLIGLGTLWENQLHPARWRVTILVAPAYRRRGVGSNLLSQINSFQPDPRPLQTATRADDEAGLSFFKRHNFSQIMRTRRGVVAPTALDAPIAAKLHAAEARIAAAGFRIERMARLAGQPGMIAQLAQLHAAIYEREHWWNPVSPIGIHDAAELFLNSSDLLPDAMYIALIRNCPVAVASLRPTASPGAVELGWTGVDPARADQADDLVLTLVGRCLRRSVIERWETHVEVDEANTRVWQLVGQLPVTWDSDWLTLAQRAGLSPKGRPGNASK